MTFIQQTFSGGDLAAYTVELLSFKDASKWAQVIESETDKDLSTIMLEGQRIDSALAKKSARIVASVIYLQN